MALIVQKFGGTTVESAEKIGSVARRVREQRACGDSLVVVVSAMGRTTESLLTLAHELSDEPSLRDVDTLLNTGEMVTMSLLSIALNNAGCPSVGLCGYQAGITTDRFFSNASISEIDLTKIRSHLQSGDVVVVAGFQGKTALGELTTLGRGGSDTTAVALAAALSADRCEILKEFPAIFTADPRIVPSAKALSVLSFDQLLEMTYWGAKVLQYRSVEIAKHFNILLYVGPAHSDLPGTTIKEHDVIEDSEVLALNSHETVLQISSPKKSLGEAIKWLRRELESRNIIFPQLLHSEIVSGEVLLFVTGPSEILEQIVVLSNQQKTKRFATQLSSVTATCRGTTRPETMEMVVRSLETKGIPIINLLVSAMSVTVFIEKALRTSAVQLLHDLIPLSAIKPQLVQRTI